MIWIRVTLWKLITGVWIIACGWGKSSGKLVRKWTKKAAGGGVVWLAGLLFGGVFLTTEVTEVTEESWLVIVSFRLSLLSSLWHGCHAPLTPDPSPPFRGRGEDWVFFAAGSAQQELRPPEAGRGRAYVSRSETRRSNFKLARRAAPGADAVEIAGSTKSQKTGNAGIASE